MVGVVLGLGLGLRGHNPNPNTTLTLIVLYHNRTVITMTFRIILSLQIV